MSHEINRKLAALFGLKRATGFDLTARVGELPALTVYTYLDDFTECAERFELKAVKLTLDEACDAALERVLAFINKRHEELSREFARGALFTQERVQWQYVTDSEPSSVEILRFRDGTHMPARA